MVVVVVVVVVVIEVVVVVVVGVGVGGGGGAVAVAVATLAGCCMLHPKYFQSSWQLEASLAEIAVDMDEAERNGV